LSHVEVRLKKSGYVSGIAAVPVSQTERRATGGQAVFSGQVGRLI
jgi:hypothetical protein